MRNLALGRLILALALTGLWPGQGWAYNKSWDQGHLYTRPVSGARGWGQRAHEAASQDDKRGTYTSKTCCQSLCKMCPVYANTGRLQKTFVDLKVPGVGPALTVTRTYQSQDWATSLLGRGWVFNLGRRLTLLRGNDGQRRLILRQGTGEINFFSEDLDGTIHLLADYGVSYQLTRNPDGTYVVVYTEGTVEHLTADGRLLQVLDRNANALSFEYNTVGCLSRIVNASGNGVDFQLGPNGKIARVSDNLGRAVQYAYDPNGNLISSTDPMGLVTQYRYDDQNRLVGIMDARGNPVLAVTYDSFQPARVATLTEKGETWWIAYRDGATVKMDGSGNTWSYSFNDLGIMESITDPTGRVRLQQPNKVTSTSMEWEQDAAGNRTSYTYGPEGNIRSETDALGNTWQYTYMAGTDRLESETDPLGVVTRFDYDGRGNPIRLIRDAGGPLENVTTYGVDSWGNRTHVTDAAGSRTVYSYDSNGNLLQITDALGNVTVYAYDARGNRLTETDPLGSTTSYLYDVMDHLLAVTGPLGYTTTYSYDANGNRTSETDSQGHTTQFIYDAYNRLSETVDPAGNHRVLRYDAEDHVVSVVEADGSLIYYSYDSLGRRIAEVRKVGDANSTPDGDDAVTRYNYDEVGNRVSSTDSEGATQFFAYDRLGRRTLETNGRGESIAMAHGSSGELASCTLADGNIIESVYDRLGRRVVVKDGQGVVATYGYDALGNRISVTDAGGTVALFSYDPAGRQVLTTTPDGPSKTYAYDAAGRVTQIAQNGGGTIRYTYDAAGRKTSITDPVGNITTAGYDSEGNLTSLTSSDGRSTQFFYDALNRLARERYPDGTERQFAYDAMGRVTQETDPNGDMILYTYDALGHLTMEDYPGDNDNTFVYDRAGRLIVGSNRTTMTRFTYDAWGAVLRTVQNGVEVSYAYDMNDHKRTLVYPDGQTVTECYNERAELMQVVDGAGNPWATYEVDASGRRLSRTLRNGYVTTFVHGPDGSQTGIVHQRAGKKTFGYEYALDGSANRIECRKAHDPGRCDQYGYDGLSRLVAFRRGARNVEGRIPEPEHQTAYVLDAAGNLVTLAEDGTTQSLSYNAMDECTKVNEMDLLYDPKGNLIEDGSLLYEYSPADQLIRVIRKSDQAVLADYEYDAFGRRTAKVVAAARTEYFYDGPRVIAERTGGRIDRTTIYGGGYVDDVIVLQTPENHLFTLADGTWSVTAVTDDQGDLVEEYCYEPYGRVTPLGPEGHPLAASSVGNPRRFTGAIYDEEVGLYYLRARYYSPSLARFLSRDPMREPLQAANPYVYCLDNPVNRVDPYGLVSWSSSRCSSRKIQMSFQTLLKWLPPSMKRKTPCKGTLSYEVSRCEKCCDSGIRRGQLSYEESDSLSVSPWQWRSPGLPFWGVTIPMADTYVGLIGYLTTSLGGNAKATINGCTDQWSGGGCVNGAVTFEAQLGTEVRDTAKARVSGAVNLSGQACLTGSSSGIRVRDRWCVSGSIKVLAELYFFSYQWVPVQASYCLSLLQPAKGENPR